MFKVLCLDFQVFFFLYFWGQMLYIPYIYFHNFVDYLIYNFCQSVKNK